jgi:hypothetical protein
MANISALKQKIQFDIDTKVFKNFPKLQSRLQFICNKLAKLEYVVNADQLSRGEILTLIENEYLSQHCKDATHEQIFGL